MPTVLNEVTFTVNNGFPHPPTPCNLYKHVPLILGITINNVRKTDPWETLVSELSHISNYFQDNGNANESLKEQEMKWSEINLQQFLQTLLSPQNNS